MGVELSETKTLQERINTRLAEQIGDLITEDDLKGIVERGVEDFLFKPRHVLRTYGGYDTHPALMQEMVEKHFQNRVTASVDAWLAANPEKIEALVKAAIDNGIANAVMSSLDQRFGNLLNYLIPQLQSQGLLPRP